MSQPDPTGGSLFSGSSVERLAPICLDDPVGVRLGVPLHQAVKAASLDLLLEPDVLVPASHISTREPVIEANPRPELVREQDSNPGVVSRARDRHLEVFGDPIDERLRIAGDAGNGSPRRPPAVSRSRYSRSSRP